MSEFVALVLFAASLVIISVAFRNLVESWYSMSDEKDLKDAKEEKE